MCGIFGAVATKGMFGPADFSKFKSATDLVQYRGPDDSGYLTVNAHSKTLTNPENFNVFLGSRRLSILDLSSRGHMPMTDGKGRWIVHNGEIFNYLELRQELEKEGYSFSTDTDTEVILSAYDRFGENGFNLFNGMWAFGILDLPGGRIVLSRDRFSIKPLYLLQDNGRLFFSSEIKQLLPLLSSKELNSNAMSVFLMQGLLDHDRHTFFSSIEKLDPRTNLVVDLNIGKIDRKTYWECTEPSLSNIDQFEVVERFRDLLLDSVKLRLRSDVKVGVLLSGGLDSSSIAVVADKMAPGRLETYSVVSTEDRFSEAKFVAELVRTGIRNHQVEFEASDVAPDLDRMLYHSDEPVGGLSVLAQYKLFASIKRNTDVTVLLSGQGGDEVLLGYLKFFFFYLRELTQKKQFMGVLAQLLGSVFHRTVMWQLRPSEARRYLSRFATRNSIAINTQRAAIPIWMCKDLRSRQLADIDQYSVPALTHYEDRNSMAHSLEVRHPFLDHRLVAFLLNIPAEYKLHNGWTKYILRKSLSELPASIRWRRDKQAFLTAEERWIRQDFAPVIRKMFQKSILEEMGILNDRAVIAHYDSFQRGRPISFGEISRLFIAERWTRGVFAYPSADRSMAS